MFQTVKDIFISFRHNFDFMFEPTDYRGLKYIKEK